MIHNCVITTDGISSTVTLMQAIVTRLTVEPPTGKPVMDPPVPDDRSLVMDSIGVSPGTTFETENP